MVLVEVILRLPDVLPQLPFLELRVVRSRAEDVAGGAGDLGLVDLVGLVVERRLGRVGHYFGTGEELGWFWVSLVALRAVFAAVVAMIGIHEIDRLSRRNLRWSLW